MDHIFRITKTARSALQPIGIFNFLDISFSVSVSDYCVCAESGLPMLKDNN